MATLHLVNKSATHDALVRCLTVTRTGDTVLLIEDGVYNALPSILARHATEGIRVVALRTDADARGVSAKLASYVALADDRDFVQLVVDHKPIVTWSSS